MKHPQVLRDPIIHSHSSVLILLPFRYSRRRTTFHSNSPHRLLELRFDRQLRIPLGQVQQQMCGTSILRSELLRLRTSVLLQSSRWRHCGRCRSAVSFLDMIAYALLLLDPRWRDDNIDIVTLTFRYVGIGLGVVVSVTFAIVCRPVH